jgi:hypothetical protein
MKLASASVERIFCMTDLSFDRVPSVKAERIFGFRETSAELKAEIKKPSPPAKRRIKAFSESCRKQSGRLASSFSLRRSGCSYEQPDKHNQTGILTSSLTSLPPSRSLDQWPVGVCSPLQWRNRLRFSRSSLTFDCIQKRTCVRRFQRACFKYDARKILASIFPTLHFFNTDLGRGQTFDQIPVAILL